VAAGSTQSWIIDHVGKADQSPALLASRSQGIGGGRGSMGTSASGSQTHHPDEPIFQWTGQQYRSGQEDKLRQLSPYRRKQHRG
jgi:hypothetical protein